jgi:hypothetical protein
MIIAYTTLLFGIPLIAARILWVVPGSISTKALAQIAGRLDEFTDAVIEGFIALLLAGLVFELLKLPVVWKVPVVLIIVSFLWNWLQGNTSHAWAFTMGIAAGFFLYPRVSPFLLTVLSF